jgi:WD40 repeat protein
MLAHANTDRTVGLFSAPHGFEHARIARASPINGVVWNPTDHSLAALDDKGVVHLATMPSGEVLTTLQHKDPKSILHVVFSRHGRFLATAASVARLVATSTGQELAQVTCTPSCPFVHFSHDGQLLATLLNGNLAHLWTTADG